MSSQLRLYLPLALHMIPTAVIAFAVVIPGGPVAGLNDHTIGFTGTLVGTVLTYHAGIRLARREITARPVDGDRCGGLALGARRRSRRWGGPHQAGER